MKKNINVQTTNATQSTTAKQNYQPTGYYLIEDEDMRKYLESTGTKIVTIALNGKKHMYALIPCETQVEADNLNRSLNTMKKKVDRSRAKHKLYEVSLDTMTTAGYDPTLDVAPAPLSITITNNTDEELTEDELTAIEELMALEEEESEDDATDASEDNGDFNDVDLSSYGKKNYARGGYDSSTDKNNPEYLYAQAVLLHELANVVNALTGEKRELVKMIASGQSERSKAIELDVSRTTLQKHKYSLLDELKEQMKDYKQNIIIHLFIGAGGFPSAPKF